MRVKNLMNKLKKCPENSHVYIVMDEPGSTHYQLVNFVETPSIKHNCKRLSKGIKITALIHRRNGGSQNNERN